MAKEVFEVMSLEEIKTIESALIDIETTCGHCPYEGEPNGCCNRPGGTCKMFDVAMDAAEALEQLRAQQPRWISVGERLPENSLRALVRVIHSYNHTDGYAEIAMSYFANGRWEDIPPKYYDVTHWMPLPEPPKEEHHD